MLLNFLLTLLVGITPKNVNNFTGILMVGAEMDKAVYANLKQSYYTGISETDIYKQIPLGLNQRIERAIMYSFAKIFGKEVEKYGYYNLLKYKLNSYLCNYIKINTDIVPKSGDVEKAYNKAIKNFERDNENLSDSFKRSIKQTIREFYKVKYELCNLAKLHLENNKQDAYSISIENFYSSLDLATDLFYLAVAANGQTIFNLTLNTRYDSSAPRRSLHKVVEAIDSRGQALAGMNTKFVPIFPQGYYNHFSSTMFELSYEGLVKLLRNNMNTNNIYKVMEFGHILPHWAQEIILRNSYTNYLLDNIKIADIDIRSLISILIIPNLFLLTAQNSEMANNEFVQSLAYSRGKMFLKSTGKVDKLAISNELLLLYYNDTTRAVTLALCAYEILNYGYSNDKGRFGGFIPAEITEELFDLKPIERNPELLYKYIKLEYLAYLVFENLDYKIPEIKIVFLDEFNSSRSKNIHLREDIVIDEKAPNSNRRFEILKNKAVEYSSRNLRVPQEIMDELDKLREEIESTSKVYSKEKVTEILSDYSKYILGAGLKHYERIEELLEDVSRLKAKIAENFIYKRDVYGMKDTIVKIKSFKGGTYIFLIEELGEDNINVTSFEELMVNEKIVPLVSKNALLLKARQNAVNPERYKESVIEACLKEIGKATCSLNRFKTDKKMIKESRKYASEIGEDFDLRENKPGREYSINFNNSEIDSKNFEELDMDGSKKAGDLSQEERMRMSTLESFLLDNLFNGVSAINEMEKEIEKLIKDVKKAKAKATIALNIYKGMPVEEALNSSLFENLSREEIEEIINEFNNLIVSGC